MSFINKSLITIVNFMDLTKRNNDLSRYKILKELGKNSSIGTITLLAENINNKEKVVIKQFSFNSGADWSGYKQVEREISVLKNLDSNIGLPHYLDSFETDTGFALVYRYIKGRSLDSVIENLDNQPLSLSQIFDLIMQLLEKLVYLQSLEVPIIHRDIKPENIILAEDGKAYLIDFGFSNLFGKKELSASSVVAGTIGFIPPEQFLHRQVSFSTDIYSLGVTLFCLLAATQTSEVGKLIDSQYYFSVDSVKDKISKEWINWLEKVTHSNPTYRFKDATEAMSSFKHLKIHPETDFDLENYIMAVSTIFLATIVLAMCSHQIFFIITDTEILPIFSSDTNTDRSTERYSW